MPRSRSRTVEVFGTSLLDMMTCSLGAVMLLMVLKRAASSDEGVRLEREIAFKTEIAEELDARRSGALEWADEALADLRAASGGAMFGMPPASGDLVLVFDCSDSMVAYGERKRNAAIAAAQAIVGSWSGLEQVALLRFADRIESVYPGDFVPAAELAGALPAEFGRVIGSAPVAGPALERAVDLLAGRPRGGTVVLVTDAAGPQGLGSSIERIAAKAMEMGRRGQGLRIHAIALADWPLPKLTDGQVLEIVKSLARAGSPKTARAKGVETANSLEQVAGQLSLDLRGLRRIASPPLVDHTSLASELRDVTESFAGRLVVYPITPLPPGS